MHDFDGVTTSVLVSRGEVYEYRYLLKGGRREVRLSSCYLKNYARLSTAIGACCPDRGERPRDFWLELKELFRSPPLLLWRGVVPIAGGLSV